MRIISNFSGEYNFLSNFYPSIIRIPNQEWEYRTVEHYFQAQKTPRGSSAHERIQEARTAAEAKKLGRQLKIHKRWDDVKVGIMLAGLNYKFKSHESLGKRLLDTGDAILIEGNTWHDIFWGMVMIKGEWTGLNMLGVLLMHVRQSMHGGFDTQAMNKD